MTAYPVERLTALAVKALLEAQLGVGYVGYATKPPSGGWQVAGTPTSTTPFRGYAVVFPGQTGPTEGPADARSFDARQGWQVTCVGATAEQADAIRDRVRGALLGARLSVIGRWFDPVDLSDSSNVARDDDVSPALFYAVDRYTARSTPN